MPPLNYGIQPDVRSRFYDPTNPVDPELPIPAPRLYAYQLPELPTRDPARFRNSGDEFVSFAQASDQLVRSQALIRRLPPAYVQATGNTLIRQVAFYEKLPQGENSATSGSSDSQAMDEDETWGGLRIAKIPKSVWNSLPASCLIRMYEFNSIREEYARTFGREPSTDHRDSSQRLTLEDIIELALINSREYQTQKENLYSVALRLSLERFDYDLKFAVSGNSTAADFIHRRDAGITENTLVVPSRVTGDQVLATGGDLLARFANDVVLTFNGPDGFAADVGSELLMDISQSVFQRDIVFERLTQSERDVVYAAREFARFRKEFFSDLANAYYGLLLTFRGIEIATQDYFSNSRGFIQGEAEYRADRLPRSQVDQFEQNALASRSTLISRCNALETGLDQLKLQIGLPTELPINLDLLELQQLTLRDEAMASAERVRRARRNLAIETEASAPDRGVLLNAAIALTRRMLVLAPLRQRLGEQTAEMKPLQIQLARLLSDEARELVRSNRVELSNARRARPPAPVRIFARSMALVDSLLTLVGRQVQRGAYESFDPVTLRQVRERARELRRQEAQVRSNLEQSVDNLVTAAGSLLFDVEALARQADTLAGYVPLSPAEELQQTSDEVDQLLESSEQVLSEDVGGLVPIDIDMDDAMLTALVQRFDLMNQRGSFADAWRRIKLAGDDLRSVLNLNATQTIRTRRDVNRAFDFTFDESETRLSMTLDTPFNRKAQRNVFRQTLIDYQAALRNLMALEDAIKLSVRDDLRQLQQIREQYQISVASAALAYDRVVTTRLQLQLGVQGITARDILESQTAYTVSLNAVASDHIDYILKRIDLFLDLELLQVDDDGFWPQIYNEQYQPTPSYQMPSYGYPPYGLLPRGVWYSHRMRRMFDVPPGHPEIHADASPRRSQNDLQLEQLPAPLPSDYEHERGSP